MERIGLYGGTFNPVHLGHLLVAQAAHEELQLDRIFFIPAAQSPFKPGVELAPAKVRLKMLRLALAGESHSEVDDQEIVRGGVSYTIDTAEAYRQRFPKARLFYLIGADHVPQLPLWRDSSQLAELVDFAIISRPGEAAVEAPPPFRSHAVQGFPLGLSSSQIRERVRLRLPIHLLVPLPVAEAIHNHELYI